MTRLLKTAMSLPVLAAALVSLGACGKLGELDRPAPIFSSFDSRPIGGVLPDPYADPNGTPR
jgi:hypothetical protein